MSTPNGYNNPAYCHQYDSSLYDYQYVPEIDPDSPVERESNRMTLVHPRHSEPSEEFEGSDESNQSIIIEECNNRRVTLICEKRKMDEYEDGAYYQDVSLESETGYGRSLRHQKPLEPPRNHPRYPTHRYEEIGEADYKPSPIHRYAEISSDENGYPTLSREIRIVPKPRAVTPPNVIEMAELSPPRRQPPIGSDRCILPKNLQEFAANRPHSLPNSPRRRNFSSPRQPKRTPVRRNISTSFVESPRSPYKSKTEIPPRSPYKPTTTEIPPRSPYKPTTQEIPPRTAIITPILQRRCLRPQTFQSTGNIYRSVKEPEERRQERPQTRLKRNQSVPNFTPNLQFSPKKPSEHVISIDKSRLSLIDQTGSWSNLGSESPPHCSTCFIFAAVVHLLTASATCAISFYLLSKVGRRYYLDFGLLAGFVNFILGLLGFRSYCWRWLPNRNYVSGFIGLAAFSAFTCAGLSYLVTARPMAGDPILDVMGGAICAVSVLTIVLALTGLTMSGCCKAPPPDNRVTDI